MILLTSFIAFKSITTKHAHTLRVITRGIACTNLRFSESIKLPKALQPSICTILNWSTMDAGFFFKTPLVVSRH